MLKRTKGRILLTMLVITGLAGTVNNSTLSNQERKFAIAQLKDTRTDLLVSVKGLSERQINFKPSADKWSIKECLYHISQTEKEVWDKLETAMKEPATPERRSELQISDEQIMKAVIDMPCKLIFAETSQNNRAQLRSISESLSNFRSSRAEHLKYVKTTTGDLRNHFIQLSIGWVDCYQAIIFMAGQCNKHIQQINELLVDPGFPRK
jgi:hypothetical protein